MTVCGIQGCELVARRTVAVMLIEHRTPTERYVEVCPYHHLVMVGDPTAKSEALTILHRLFFNLDKRIPHWRVSITHAEERTVLRAFPRLFPTQERQP